jgi:uncharacterized protein (DUF58 family)
VPGRLRTREKSEEISRPPVSESEAKKKLPKPTALEGNPPAGHPAPSKKRLPGAGREFSHYRDYTPDDDYRHVSWKASQRLIQRFRKFRQC